MYGVEAQSGGLGGLAAQAPPDVYFPGALAIMPGYGGVSGGPGVTGTTLPNIGAVGMRVGDTPAAVSSAGNAVNVPPSMQHAHWSSIFDFHNSVAPWILLGILLLYGWLHASARVTGRAGPLRAGAEAVL